LHIWPREVGCNVTYFFLAEEGSEDQASEDEDDSDNDEDDDESGKVTISKKELNELRIDARVLHKIKGYMRKKVNCCYG
jgi:hypothetical protein